MLKSTKKDLVDELEEKQEMANATVLEKQETRVKETLKEQEAKITEMMKSGSEAPKPEEDNPENNLKNHFHIRY